MATLRRICCPTTGELLDKGMVLWFPGPHSFTGEDCVEFHCHGGKAVIDGILNGIGNISKSVRLAEPGEFARRAFENDKLDLTEVEGLADLLAAETAAQRRLALKQAGGSLRTLYDTWREQLIQNMALIEALIDFGEDENIEDDVYDTVYKRVTKLYRDITDHLNDNRRGEILRDGIHATIFGPPNAGKSSFLNHITQRQAAIVSPIPGTTRDIVEVSLDIGGFPILIGDTAGLRRSNDVIEMEGVKRAQDRIQTADINIAILPVTDFDPAPTCTKSSAEGVKDSPDPIVLQAIRDNPDTLVLINKVDLAKDENTQRLLDTIGAQIWTDPQPHENHQCPQRNLWAVSCQTGAGLDKFVNDFVNILKNKYESATTASSSITQHRHRKHLQNCVESLEAFLELGPEDVVLGAEELRHAATDLGRITGRVDIEEVLDVIFREFCIGK
ncbi:tRNA modification GTPase gtpbp3, mitochondrial [Actinomortierella wolfii]|nr:tRNA modification GTPase gtpbp3, mitochondrial [Actinomortierella wolfii]